MYVYLFQPHFHPSTALFHPVHLLKFKQFEKRNIHVFFNIDRVMKYSCIKLWKLISSDGSPMFFFFFYPSKIDLIHCALIKKLYFALVCLFFNFEVLVSMLLVEGALITFDRSNTIVILYAYFVLYISWI